MGRAWWLAVAMLLTGVVAGSVEITRADAVVRPAATPTIVDFAPAAGPVGTTVTITGAGFTDATDVTFGGTTAAFTVANDGQLDATVPTGAATGRIRVATPDGSVTSATDFTVTTPPEISGFSPATGPAGTAVTISGANLTDATAVAFNGTAAAFTVADATHIATSVPAGATSGSITVTTPAGTATSTTRFRVTAARPTITGVTPPSGPVGTAVTITGSGLTGATAVKFQGTAARFTVTDATHIATTVPAGASTGTITVTTPGGTATSATSFTVTTAGAVTVNAADYAFSPASATVRQGGTLSWVFLGPHAHSASDRALLGAASGRLFDSGARSSGSYDATFAAAGIYAYGSTASEPRPMTGKVAVPLEISPSSGHPGSTIFTLRLASAAAAGYGYHAQLRFRAAGSSTWGPWQDLFGVPTQTQPSVRLTVSQAGIYAFRSQLRNASTGKVSGYSPGITIVTS